MHMITGCVSTTVGLTRAERCSIWGSGPTHHIGPVRYKTADSEGPGTEVVVRVSSLPDELADVDIEGWAIHVSRSSDDGLDTVLGGEIIEVQRNDTGHHKLRARGTANPP